jgi:hypothetical protein
MSSEEPKAEPTDGDPEPDPVTAAPSGSEPHAGSEPAAAEPLETEEKAAPQAEPVGELFFSELQGEPLERLVESDNSAAPPNRPEDD